MNFEKTSLLGLGVRVRVRVIDRVRVYHTIMTADNKSNYNFFEHLYNNIVVN